MEVTLEAVERSEFGKNESRRLRREGRIPAVVYGAISKTTGTASHSISVDPKSLMQIFHSDSGVNTLIDLSIDGGKPSRVLIKDYQLDPIKDMLLHIDFYRVAMDQNITVTVPVVVTGEALGVKQQDGLLDFVHRDIEIECLPADIPEHLEVDVSSLMIGQGVRLRDLVQDVAWKPISSLDTLLVHVIAPKAEVEEEAEEGSEAEAATAESAEPEVIKKGKADSDVEDESESSN